MTTTCEKELFIIRGCSGSGKSTVAEALYTMNSVHFEADMFHYNADGVYDWKLHYLKDSHEWCQGNVRAAMQMGKERVIVSNTSTTEKELDPYLKLAKEYNYKVTCLVVEHRHEGTNIHNVPNDVIKAQSYRLQNNLKLTK